MFVKPLKEIDIKILLWEQNTFINWPHDAKKSQVIKWFFSIDSWTPNFLKETTSLQKCLKNFLAMIILKHTIKETTALQ